VSCLSCSLGISLHTKSSFPWRRSFSGGVITSTVLSLLLLPTLALKYGGAGIVNEETGAGEKMIHHLPDRDFGEAA
jgi:hypothetical protein